MIDTLNTHHPTMKPRREPQKPLTQSLPVLILPGGKDEGSKDERPQLSIPPSLRGGWAGQTKDATPPASPRPGASGHNRSP